MRNRLIAKESFAGNKSMTKTFTNIMGSLVFYNDGQRNAITLTINQETFVVNPGEKFDENLDYFDRIEILNVGNEPFRCYGRS